MSFCMQWRRAGGPRRREASLASCWKSFSNTHCSAATTLRGDADRHLSERHTASQNAQFESFAAHVPIVQTRLADFKRQTMRRKKKKGGENRGIILQDGWHNVGPGMDIFGVTLKRSRCLYMR